MKQILVITSLLMSLFAAHGIAAAEPKFSPLHEKSSMNALAQRQVSIHVADGDWGNANPTEIKVLLDAVAADMLARFPGRQLAPIEVFPSRNRPVVLYQKGPANQYQVHLAASDRNWAEYIYEFSHELFHILANYEYHASSGGTQHLWFEEMMCEAASLHTLKRLSLAWQTSGPGTEWASYVPTLNKYTQRALTEPHRRLPADKTLAQWFRENERALLGNPHLRAKNEMVAMLFLPLLEQNADWSAVGFLNPPTRQKAMNFYAYLAGWYSNTPAANRDFVAHAMNLFEFHAPATIAHASDSQQPQSGMTVLPDAVLDVNIFTREAGAAGTMRN